MEFLTAFSTGRATAWVALLTLVAMEVVLGIDNLIFISILTNKLPERQQRRARRLGIGAALIMRLAAAGDHLLIVQLTRRCSPLSAMPSPGAT
jgi:predicted tellurium resistance membrane protein TerC